MQKIQPDQNNLDERHPAKAKFSSFGDDGGASGGVAFSDGGIVALTFLRAARGQGYAIVNVARRIQKDV
jgi:hypothetical protein